MRTRSVALCVALLATGCGAAYYGTALGIVASQKDKKVIDQSFPDGALFAAEAPAVVRMQLSSNQVTVQRDTTTFDPSGVGSGSSSSLTDFEILSFDFPPGYGVAISNRDAGTTISDGDRLVVRINEDDAQEITFAAADVASTGSAVAAVIQAKVRALTPAAGSVPAEAYTLFSGSYDPSTRSYRFQSGSPGETSEVAFEPTPRTSRSDDAPNASSAATAARLGLGPTNGGIETDGSESVSFVVLNRGTDVLPAGTRVRLFLSRDKVLDSRLDLPIDEVALDRSVQVGRAVTFRRRNGDMPPVRLLRGDVVEGRYYLILQMDGAAGEQSLDDNVLVAAQPIEVFQPVEDPATTAVEVANTLDIFPTRTSAPVAGVTGSTLSTVVTLSNFGAPIVAPTLVDLDLVLSADEALDAPAAFRDPAGVIAGVRINPTDATQPVLVRILQSGTNPLQVGVSGNVVTASYDGTDNGATAATVQDLITALNGLVGAPVDAFSDGSGAPATDTLNALLTAAAATEVEARDVFVAARTVTFGVAPQPLATQSFVLEGDLRTTSFKATTLPIKLTPLFVVRPRLTVGDPQDPTTDVRRATNFVRIYDRMKATFDSVTGATLPTVNTDDFAALDAVTLRPVNTGSIRQGQQRVFRFEIPATGLSVDESQLLVILRTDNFDARLDLLSASGSFIVGADDGPLGQDPMIYTAVQSNSQSRSFYLVVSAAREDESDLRGGSETFELTISVNPRRSTDLGLVAGVDGGNVLRRVPQSYAAGEDRTVNDALIPFSLSNGKAEVSFVLPERARVRFLTRPVFTSGVRTVITRFVKGSVPAPVSHQAVLDATTSGIIYRPPGGGVDSSHVLDGGVYTVAFETSGGVPDTQDLRLEISTLFLPD